jgi:CxxC motif-containing protein
MGSNIELENQLEKVKLTCIICPVSCVIDIEHKNKQIQSLSGHQCKKGKIYAVDEFTEPKRTLTTTVKLNCGILPLVSVRTDKPVRKELMFRIMDDIMELSIDAPVTIGDVLLENVQNSEANIIATKTVERLNNGVIKEQSN